MRFSSIAVSLLAQSVPLLAVGHLAGWKKREERSWLQRRRLRDALLMGVHDKKGMLFEKHVRGHGKQVDVLEKKRLGSARLVQVDVSSEASVECVPLSKVTDSGIFGCGMDRHCVENEESKMGGFCVASNVAPSINRALQTGFDCVEENSYGFTCDCSQFNNTIGAGNYNCSGPFCLGTKCGTVSMNYSVAADGSYVGQHCYELSGGKTLMGLEKICYDYDYNKDANSTECVITANGVQCDSCEYNQDACPPLSDKDSYLAFDCTNTVMNMEGKTCSPLVEPLVDGANATATSSGSSHAAKVTLVASAVAASWMASFGI